MALVRARAADYDVHEQCQMDTQDHEDHTFCGVMFSILVKADLPVDFVEIDALSVRGDLGPLTVWAAPGHWNDASASGEPKFSDARAWRRVYRGDHAPSRRKLVTLALDTKVRLQPGLMASLYVHSMLANDRALVYDNQRSRSDIAQEDALLQVGARGTPCGRRARKSLRRRRVETNVLPLTPQLPPSPRPCSLSPLALLLLLS